MTAEAAYLAAPIPAPPETAKKDRNRWLFTS